MPLSSPPLDRAAIAFSGLCAVHCLLVTLAAASLPLWGLAWATTPVFHEIMLAVVIPLSLLALWAGYRSHRHRRIAATGLAGLGLMTLAVLLRESGVIGSAGETVMTLSGATLLAGTHLYNLRASRGHAHADAAPCPLADDESCREHHDHESGHR